MIFKEFDSKQGTLSILKKLFNDSSSHSQKALIKKELTSIKNGMEYPL